MFEYKQMLKDTVLSSVFLLTLEKKNKKTKAINKSSGW